MISLKLNRSVKGLKMSYLFPMKEVSHFKAPQKNQEEIGTSLTLGQAPKYYESCLELKI